MMMAPPSPPLLLPASTKTLSKSHPHLQASSLNYTNLDATVTEENVVSGDKPRLLPLRNAKSNSPRAMRQSSPFDTKESLQNHHSTNDPLASSSSVPFLHSNGHESSDPCDKFSSGTNPNCNGNDNGNNGNNEESMNTHDGGTTRQLHAVDNGKPEDTNNAGEKGGVPTGATSAKSLRTADGKDKHKPPTERRSLRSHDAGAWSRCELASYFSNYEQLMSLEPPERGILPHLVPSRCK